MHFGRGKGRRWLDGISGAVVVCLIFVAHGFGQTSDEPGKRGGKSERAKAGRAAPIELVVDGAVKRTWTLEELQRLATAKWENRGGTPHPAIPLSALLKESGVARDAIVELRVSSGGRAVALKEADMAKVDQLVLRTGQKSFDRPWRLVPLDPSIQPTRDAYTLPGVRRIEIVTRATSK